MLDFSLILPELFVLGMACVVLLVDLFVPQRQQTLTYLLTQLTLLGALFISLMIFPTKAVLDFHGLFVHDQLASILKIVIYITSIFVFMYSRDYMRHHDMGRGEPYLLGLFAILGMMILVSGHNLLTLYLGLELMSLPIYALVALQRDSERASEAGMKYLSR